MAHYSKVAADSVLVLRDAGQVLSVTFYSGETATDADGSVTIGIVDEAGNTVVASGTSTSKTATGIYAYTLAAQTNLKNLTATWTGTWTTEMSFKTRHEIVGGFYTTPAEVRAMDSLAGETSTFSAEDLVGSISYATKVIDDYMGDKGLGSIERVIHKMTGLTAKNLGIQNRGEIKVDSYADLILFDPDQIQDNATFEQPNRLSDGIHSVWVNGKQVLADGVLTEHLPGKIILREVN